MTKPNFKLNPLTAVVAIALTASANVSAQELVTEYSSTPESMVQTLLGDNITVSNISVKGSAYSIGSFSGAQDVIGFDSGIVLSSGDVAKTEGQNIYDYTSYVNFLGGDPELNSLIPGYSTYDATVLEFDFVAPADVISFQYVFTSEEYNEWVNTAFNDVFGFFLDGVNIAKIPGTDISVSINNVNNGNPYGQNVSNPQYFVNNDLSDGGGQLMTEMDGLTVVLSVEAHVTAGETHHIKMAIADAGDYIYDSNVFIKAQSFVAAPSDIDEDTITDGEDNCLHTPNTDQLDYDGDGVGDACDETGQPPVLNFVKFTGGGGVTGNKVTNSFGFNLKSTPTGIDVHLEYNDGSKSKAKTPSIKQIKMKGNIDQITALESETGTGVEFTGPCTVRTQTKGNGNERLVNQCKVTLLDNGSNGTGNKKKGIAADQFHLVVTDGPDAGYESGSLNLVRGNITAHKE